MGSDRTDGRVLGAQWFARWMRARRAERGLDRHQLVQRSRVNRAPGVASLTSTIVADLECGDRLPNMRRVPALAHALGVPAVVIAETTRLAPVIEPAWANLEREGWREDTLRARAACALAHGDALDAAAAADTAAHIEGGAGGVGSRLLYARALVLLGFGVLARDIASSLLEAATAPAHRFESLLVSCESWLHDGRPATAAIWCAGLTALAGHPEIAREPSLVLRATLVEAELALHGGQPQRAADLLLKAADEARAHRAEGLARVADERLEFALRRAGRTREAELWSARRRSGTAEPVPGDAARRHGHAAEPPL